MFQTSGFALDRLRCLQTLNHPLPSVDEVVAELRPADPVLCHRPGALAETAKRFQQLFPGRVLYAAKCNPNPSVLRALYDAGIRAFDVASLGEIELVRGLFPDAFLAYMHPVKARSAIRAAYEAHGVRDFALDTEAELDKILAETAGAKDLGLHVRLALPKADTAYDLTGRFGARAEDAVVLLKRARGVARRLGVCFHVGSQCFDPAAYERALALAGPVIAAAGVTLDVLDVGGGFPVSYADRTPLPFDDFIQAIRRGIAQLGLPAACEVWCEPGRALVAAGASLVVQVLMRRGYQLFINDGIYGNLSDAGVPGFRFPVRRIQSSGGAVQPREQFVLLGPTCDSADRMAGPFMLPSDIGEGDWIEVGQVGAYGQTLRTAFNGFTRGVEVEVRDLPLIGTPGLHAGLDSATVVTPAPMPLFVFGSLLDRDVLRVVLGRDTDGLVFRDAAIHGFRRRRVQGERYPMVVPRPGGVVQGTLIDGLTTGDLDRLRFYETNDYGLRQFDVSTADGQRLPAQVFIAERRLRQSNEGWDLDSWRRMEKPFALAVAEEAMALYGKMSADEIVALWPEIEARARGRLASAVPVRLTPRARRRK